MHPAAAGNPANFSTKGVRLSGEENRRPAMARGSLSFPGLGNHASVLDGEVPLVRIFKPDQKLV
jgi:hypothetical protein